MVAMFMHGSLPASAQILNVVAQIMRMLIGYARPFGSTRDIAIPIAGTVRTRGVDVDVRSVDELSDFNQCDAVVFGSGVYDRLLFKALGGHAGDNRQWPDIDEWAERIAQTLRAQHLQRVWG